MLSRIAQYVKKEKLAPMDNEKTIEYTLSSEVSPYYEQIISFLPSEAFKSLQAVGRGKIPPPSSGFLLSLLVKQGFLVENKDVYSCFSPSFNLFIRKQLTKKLLKGKITNIE